MTEICWVLTQGLSGITAATSSKTAINTGKLFRPVYKWSSFSKSSLWGNCFLSQTWKHFLLVAGSQPPKQQYQELSNSSEYHYMLFEVGAQQDHQMSQQSLDSLFFLPLVAVLSCRSLAWQIHIFGDFSIAVVSWGLVKEESLGTYAGDGGSSVSNLQQRRGHSIN